MTDRELLELAAKAAGREVGRDDQCDPIDRKYCAGLGLWCVGPWAGWFNPLNDDGDALRLAAKLKIDLEWQATSIHPEPAIEAYKRDEKAGHFYCASEHENDYRRAIVRAAAEIGRAQAASNENGQRGSGE
jgi:hypothetical protein